MLNKLNEAKGKVSSLKNILIAILIFIAISGTCIYFFRNTLLDKIWKDNSSMKIGKPLSLQVDSNKVVDFAVIDKYILWDKDERQRVVEYMKRNNYKIKEGFYQFNQATTFERALEIFKFEKM
jgi:cell division protein YceG involved in septum cleavage